jgi:hypothetical protein
MSWKSLQKKKKINVSIPAVSSAGNDSHYLMNCCSINQSHHPTKASNGIPSSLSCVLNLITVTVCVMKIFFSSAFFFFLFFFCVLCFFLFLPFCFPFPVFALLVLWCCGLRCCSGWTTDHRPQTLQGRRQGSAASVGEADRRKGCLLVEFYGACTKLLNFEFLATTAPGVKNLVYAYALWILFREFRCTVETKSLMGATS